MTGETILRRKQPYITLDPDTRRYMASDGIIDQREFSALLLGHTTYGADRPIISTPDMLNAFRKLQLAVEGESAGTVNPRAIMEQLRNDLRIANVTGSEANPPALHFTPGDALAIMRRVAVQELTPPR